MSFALLAHTHAASQNNTVTPSIDTTGGDLLVLHVGSYAGVLAPNISDSKGNSWTGLTQKSSAIGRSKLYYVKNPTVGTGHTFSASVSGGAYEGIEASAWSGSDTTTPFDVENGATASGVTSLSTGSVTPSNNNSLVVTGLSNGDNTSAYNVPTGYSLLDQDPWSAGVNEAAVAAYQIQTTATATNPSWSWTGSANAAATIAVFKAAGGATVHPYWLGVADQMTIGPV